MKVEAFSFGFGPRLFGFRKGETDFRFSAILFGGYVKMAGEQPGDEALGSASFSGQAPLAATDHRLRRSRHEHHPGGGLLTGLFMVRYPKLANADDPATIGYVTRVRPRPRRDCRKATRSFRSTTFAIRSGRTSC